MAIFVTGDTHGADQLGFFDVSGYMPRFNTRNFPEQKQMTKDDYVIICGDFGGIWSTDRNKLAETAKEKHDLDWLNEKPFTTLFVPGNHENYDRLTGIKDEKLLNSWLFEKMSDEDKKKLRQGYPRKQWHGGYVREIRPSILMLEPGVFEIDGMKIFAYGGAPSHDISGGILNPSDYNSETQFKNAYARKNQGSLPFRVKGISWWEQEQPDTDAEKQAEAALQANDYKVDFIFTHDCATSDRAILGYGDEITRINQFLEIIKYKTEYKHWFFGHLHNNVNLPGHKEHLIYEQVVQIA